jgi:elongation factor G
VDLLAEYRRATMFFEAGNPTEAARLLEPIVEAEVRVPERYLGDIMSDLNGKRGRISGSEPDDGWQVVRATVPEAEMQRFALDLRSITQGRGSFRTRFSHYEELPAHLARPLIEAYQKEQ